PGPTHAPTACSYRASAVSARSAGTVSKDLTTPAQPVGYSSMSHPAAIAAAAALPSGAAAVAPPMMNASVTVSPRNPSVSRRYPRMIGENVAADPLASHRG